MLVSDARAGIHRVWWTSREASTDRGITAPQPHNHASGTQKLQPGLGESITFGSMIVGMIVVLLKQEELLCFKEQQSCSQ